MERIISLEIRMQRRAGKRARKNVVRRTSADGPFQDRIIHIDCDIAAGAGSHANFEVRKVLAAELRKKKEGETFFYVRAEFEHTGRIGVKQIRYFKTIVPRQAIPF